MCMLVLERKGNEVFCQGSKLRINAQASKGPNNEVVDVEGLEGSNGQKWVSLSRLQEGTNNIETKAKVVTTRQYSLTTEESAKIAKLQAQIDAIVDQAKSRYIPKAKLTHLDPTTMSKDEKANAIAQLKALMAKMEQE